jgi:hypothetical protein
MQATPNPRFHPIRIAFGVIAAAFLTQTALSASGQEQPAAETNQAGYRIVGGYITGASDILPVAGKVESKLQFDSSDTRLVEGFTWAKRQSLAYVFEGDPVGPWYEAGEPGREAFSMRDTSHQAMGAQALGLARFTHNMLHRFAENISESRDWCSYWGIERYNRPRRVDYKNNAEFWYNLPANFDVLDCCFRMYVWTGDRTYVNDPVFQNYYDRTVNDYVQRWALGLDQIMTRPRHMNVRGIYDPKSKFQPNRGIPGYNEQDPTYVLGFDVLATQHAAYLGYAHFQEVRGNAGLAQACLKKADDLRDFVNKTWWNEAEKGYYARLNGDYKLEGRGPQSLQWGRVRYDDPDAGYERLMNAAFGPRSRREYPEVPFSWIGDLVNGTMGINLVFTSPLQAAEKGYWVETMVKTLSGLGTKIAWAELRNLPVRADEVTVRHEGMRKTVFTNQHGPALIWQATFNGTHPTLLVNGRPMRATTEESPENPATSWVRVTVGGGGTATVEIPN